MPLQITMRVANRDRKRYIGYMSCRKLGLAIISGLPGAGKTELMA